MSKFIKNNLFMILGNLLYALGVNLFIVPVGLYTGGVYGFCQLIRTFISHYFELPNIDIAGILYGIANIPLLILAYRKISKKFFYSTIVSVLIGNLFLTFIVFNKPIIDDTLASCIIGGIIAGIGGGLTLRAGSSGGGTDILAMYLLKNNSKLSIGNINLSINVILYLICAFIFSPAIAIYSIIYSAISSVALDRMHTQNIEINALIFTNNYQIAEEINKKMRRGSTSWEGRGDYTKNKKYIISTVISKYEEDELKKIVQELDKNAFVIINSNVDIIGFMEKRLDA